MHTEGKKERKGRFITEWFFATLRELNPTNSDFHLLLKYSGNIYL